MNLRLTGLKIPENMKNNLINQFKEFVNVEFDINKHPLQWLEDRYSLNEIVNFFETTATAYSKSIKIDEW